MYFIAFSRIQELCGISTHKSELHGIFTFFPRGTIVWTDFFIHHLAKMGNWSPVSCGIFMNSGISRNLNAQEWTSWYFYVFFGDANDSDGLLHTQFSKNGKLKSGVWWHFHEFWDFVECLCTIVNFMIISLFVRSREWFKGRPTCTI